MARSRSRSPKVGYRRARESSTDRYHDSRYESGSHDRNRSRHDHRQRERYQDRHSPRSRRDDGRSHERRREDRGYKDRDARGRHEPPRVSFRPVHEPSPERSSRDRTPSARPQDDTVGRREQSDDRKKGDTPTADTQSGDKVDDTEAQMAAMMGFAGFSTTKGSKVQGNLNKVIVAKPVKKIEYRQYMNRPGGFNRPLDSTTL